jgi:hypothetical protein
MTILAPPGQPSNTRPSGWPPEPPHRRDPPECDWCFWPLDDSAVELNGGIGHERCARYVYECVEGPDAVPWQPRLRWWRDDPLLDFLVHLGREARLVGIDPHRLAQAVGRARSA